MVRGVGARFIGRIRNSPFYEIELVLKGQNMVKKKFKLNILKNTTDNRGIALVMVLWVLLLLIGIVLEFSFAMRTEVDATRNFKDETTCYYNARSGFQRAVAELIKNFAVKKEEDSEESTWRADQREVTLTMSHGTAEIIIADEAGKYNANTISEEMLRNLIASLGAEEKERDIVTDSILDWRDENKLHRLNGAEDDYYDSLPNPYSCKDGPFDTVEELLLVRGITPSLFYGAYLLSDEDGGKLVWQKGLVDLITGYSRSNRVDANTAPEEILLSIPGLDKGAVDSIIRARAEKPIKNIQELKTIIGDHIYSLISKHLSVTSSRIYSIVSTGFVPESDVQRSVKGVVIINLGSEKKYQIVYWADNYPRPESLVYINHIPWGTGDQKPL